VASAHWSGASLAARPSTGAAAQGARAFPGTGDGCGLGSPNPPSPRGIAADAMRAIGSPVVVDEDALGTEDRPLLALAEEVDDATATNDGR
jgi:hypothetical protein